MKKLISNQISPNLKLIDFLVGFRGLFCIRQKLNFEQFFYTKNFFLCNAARTGLAKIIEVLDLPPKRIVGIPAFCCGVMATPFLARDFKIRWLDTDENGNLDFENFKKKAGGISILLVPHIFGQKNDMKRIFDFCEKNNVFLIEDEAHSFFPLKSEKDEFFHAKILSFGREKTFSCVSGGAVVWRKNSRYHENFLKAKSTLPKASEVWTFKHLSQIFIFSIALPWWYQGGKMIPYLAQKLKWLPFAVTSKEKNGIEDFPQTQLPSALQRILYRQFSNTEKIQAHRKKMALEWEKELSRKFSDCEVVIPENYFRVILKCPSVRKRDEIFSKAKKQGLLLQEWDGKPIAPKSVNLKNFQYQKNSCPKAEKFSQTYLTFPTNIRVSLKNIAKIFEAW